MSPSVARRLENPLVELMAMAAKKHGSPVYRDALARLGPLSAVVVEHLAASAGSLQNKLHSLPRATVTLPNRYDLAISSAMALAALTRFDDYVQDELERRSLRRTHVNATGDDFMLAIRETWQKDGEAALVRLVAREAASFLDFVQRYGDLKSAVRTRLTDFKQLT